MRLPIAEFYDLNTDPWQQVNLWGKLTPAMQQELKAEIAHHFACGGDTETPSNCE